MEVLPEGSDRWEEEGGSVCGKTGESSTEKANLELGRNPKGLKER